MQIFGLKEKVVVVSRTLISSALRISRKKKKITLQTKTMQPAGNCGSFLDDDVRACPPFTPTHPRPPTPPNPPLSATLFVRSIIAAFTEKKK